MTPVNEDDMMSDSIIHNTVNSKELMHLINRHKKSKSNPRNGQAEQFNSIYSEQLHKPVSPKGNVPYLMKLKQKVNKKKRDKSKMMALRFPLIVEDEGNGLVVNGHLDQLGAR
jgi:hypothetical protein